MAISPLTFRRQDVKGFIKHKPLWLTRPLGIEEVRKHAANMEYEAERFYRKAAETTRDVSVRELLVRLAEMEFEPRGPRGMNSNANC